MRRMWIAAAAVLALAACGKGPAGTTGSGAPLPASQQGALNAPSTQNAASAEGQASISAEQDQQLRQLVSTYLDHATSNYGQGMGAAPGFSDEITSLQPGRDYRWQVNLVGGTTYRIIGACDNECSNIDIELIDGRGGVVASDMLPDDIPVVNFTPANNGTYIVRTLMQACRVAPCYTGARILTQGGTPPAGAAAPSKPT